MPDFYAPETEFERMNSCGVFDSSDDTVWEWKILNRGWHTEWEATVQHFFPSTAPDRYFQEQITATEKEIAYWEFMTSGQAEFL